MNRKITFPKLTEAVASLTSVSEATAEAFIKQLFELIADTVAKGKSVTVKGLGTFSPTDDPDSPVTWIPDSALAEAVNEPFAFFEAVELGDGVTEEILTAQTSDLPTSGTIPPPIPAMSATPASPAVTAPSIPPIPKTMPTEEENLSEPETMPEPGNEPQPDDEVSWLDNEEKASRQKWHLNPWLMFLAGIILGFVANHVYTCYISNNQDNNIVKNVIVTDTVRKTAPVAAPLPADSIAGQPSMPQASYQPIAIDTVTTSRYLTTMARKYYGNYKFWVYIYEENSDIVSDPNRIRPGTPVVIPAPEKYDIDASDPESVKKAEKRIAEISAGLAK